MANVLALSLNRLVTGTVSAVVVTASCRLRDLPRVFRRLVPGGRDPQDASAIRVAAIPYEGYTLRLGPSALVDSGGQYLSTRFWPAFMPRPLTEAMGLYGERTEPNSIAYFSSIGHCIFTVYKPISRRKLFK
jgi:hypothetical protein